MDRDDGLRAKAGLVLCLRDMGNGSSRIFLDDVTTAGSKNPIQWNFTSFYTCTPEYESGAVARMGLTPDQFQIIGEAVVTRLIALNKREATPRNPGDP